MNKNSMPGEDKLAFFITALLFAGTLTVCTLLGFIPIAAYVVLFGAPILMTALLLVERD